MWHSTARQYLILTSIFGPLQDGRDLVALLGFADAVASGRVNADGVEVGLHAAQVGRGRGRTVGDLEVHAVRLHRNANTQRHNILYYQLCLANLRLCWFSFVCLVILMKTFDISWGFSSCFTLTSPTLGKVSMVITVSSPVWFCSCPFRIRADVYVVIPIPEAQNTNLKHKQTVLTVSLKNSVNIFLAQFAAKWSQSQQTGGMLSSVCKMCDYHYCIYVFWM